MFRIVFIKICNFLFGKQANDSLPRTWVLFFDIMVLFLAYVISMFLVYYNSLADKYLFKDWYRIFIVMSVYVIMFLSYRTYYGIIRYSGFDDIRKIFNSCTTALALLIIAKLVIAQINPKIVSHILPGYRIIMYHYLMTLVIMVISRFFIRRIYNEMYKNPSRIKQPTVIYGAGEGGVMLFRAIQQDKASLFKVMAFADDNPKKTNKDINTIPVYSPDKIFSDEFIKKV